MQFGLDGAHQIIYHELQSSLLINEMCTKIQRKCGGIEKLAFNPIMCDLTTDT